jgi:hypothetical protein
MGWGTGGSGQELWAPESWAKELSRNKTVKSGGTGILTVSGQHGQDGHATQSAAVLLLFARLANNTVLILDKF